MGPADLPHFSVSGSLGDRYRGLFDASPWVGEDWIAGLYLGGGRFLWGRFRDVDAEARSCSFRPDEVAQPSALSPGESYPFMESYWGRRAELVLDEGRHWHRADFKAGDMVRYPVEGGGRLSTRSSSQAPAGGEVVPGGWDHEHCEICWQRIGSGGEPEAFFSPQNSWVCEACYGHFVVPRSLAFAKDA